MTHSSWRSLSNGCMLICSRKCSAINNLSKASALQLPNSGLYNLRLCVTLGSMQKFLGLFWVLLLQVMPFKLTIFRYDCIITNSTKGFCWISRIGSRHWTNLSSESCNHICRNFWQLWFTRKFCQTLLSNVSSNLLLTSVAESLGNIVPWDTNILYQCCLITYSKALTKHTSKLFRLHQAI